MTNKKPEWEELEIMVGEIQKQLAPTAEIRHDHRVMGKSGRKRKLDVTISQNVSTFPMFVVFDCKHHSKPVKLKDVAAFSVQLDDVDATLGVMVSSSGFDAGAKAIAKQKRIILQTFHKADETDWRELLGENAWSVITGVELYRVNAIAFLAGNPTPIEIAFNTPIYDEKGETSDTLNNTFWEVWNGIGKFIGDVNGQVSFEGLPSFIKIENELLQIQNAVLSAKVVAKKYLVNLYMAQGSILEEEGNSKPIYRSVTSEGFDWAEIINNQPGIEINNDEYQKILHEATIMVDLSKARRYIRVVAKAKNAQDQAHS